MSESPKFKTVTNSNGSVDVPIVESGELPKVDVEADYKVEENYKEEESPLSEET